MKYTLKDIANYLADNQTFEYDNGDYIYWLYMNEKGELVSQLSEADCYFNAYFGGEPEDDSYDWETLDNEDFRNVCEYFLEKLNEEGLNE